MCSDVVFKVEGHEIAAHRNLLSVRCSHFKQLFASGMKDAAEGVVHIDDIEFNVFQQLLKYSVCGCVRSFVH